MSFLVSSELFNIILICYVLVVVTAVFLILCSKENLLTKLLGFLVATCIPFIGSLFVIIAVLKRSKTLKEDSIPS